MLICINCRKFDKKLYSCGGCNGATNIYKIAKNAINKKLRPSYLTRGNTSGVLDDTLKT